MFEKITGFIKKHRAVFFAMVAGLLVLLIGTSIFWLKVWRYKNYPAKSKTLGDITEFDGELSVMPGDTLDQTYTVEELEYRKLGMYFKSNSDDDNGSIFVKVSFEKEEFSAKIANKDINGSGYTYLKLPDEFYQKVSAPLSVELTTDIKAGFTVVTNKSFEVPDSETVLNGETLEEKVVIDLRTDKTNRSLAFYITFLILASVFMAALTFVICKKKWSIALITAVAVAFLGISYMFIFTPNTVPDESLHYRTAYHVSNKMMFRFNDKQYNWYMRGEDLTYHNSARPGLTAQEYNRTIDNAHLFCKDKEMTVTHSGYMENSDFLYLFSGVGITLARLIGLSAYWTYLMGRLFNIIQFALAVYFAIKIMPFGKAALSVIALLPMSLHIAASVSYDVFTMSGVMLIFAYYMKLHYSEEKIGWKQLLILGVMIFLVIPQKIVYIALAAIVLLLPKDNFKTPKYHFLFKCILGAVAVVGILVFQFLSFAKLNSETVTNTANLGYSLPYILRNPKETISILINTVYVSTDFYIKSLVAYFGFFQIEMPWYLALAMLTILLIAFQRREDEPTALKPLPRVYAFVLFAIVFVAVEIILLIDHTTLGAGAVMGIQGRYFIPALPLLYLFIRNNTLTLKKNMDNQLIFAASGVNVVMLFAVMAAVLGQ
ncbi:MAG: DUF2142 domain-containing protein [Clostridia bacterium]|nr:DUF2142 domain-containing protein [Clostridia bacterium]